MKRWLVLCSLLLCLSYTWADSIRMANNNEKYKLLRELNELAENDTTRLMLYFKITQLGNIDFEKYYNDKLLAEAKRLNNDKYQCKAYLSRMVSAYNQYNVKEVNRLMGLLEPLALKNDFNDLWFMARRCVVDMLIMTGEYEHQLKEAQKMLQDAEKMDNEMGIMLAYQSLTLGLRMTYRTEEAVELSKKAYAIASISDPKLALEINNSIISCYESLNDYKNWFKWLRIMDNSLRDLVKKGAGKYQGWQMMVAVYYINYYTTVKDFQSAKASMQKAEQYNMDNYSVYSFYHHRARHFYFDSAGLYEEALAETEILADIYKELSPLAYSSMRFLNAEALEKLGRYDDALTVYKQAFKIADSTNIALLNTQTEQLKHDYNTEQLQLKKAEISRNVQFFFLVLIGLTTLCIIAFAIHAITVRKGLRRSEKEMRKMAEEMEQANLAKENFLATISTAINVPLTAVVNGSLQLCKDEVTDKDERKKISADITSTSAELMVLINNILDLSKLEAGMMKFKMEEIEMIPFVQGMVTMAVSDGKKIEADIPSPEMELKILGDIGRMGEALKRLFIATPDKTVHLSMTLSENKKQLLITISNAYLASYKKQTRDTAMGNEINRLTMENFKGRYEVDLATATARITLPLV